MVAVLLVDTSASMEYRSSDARSRLDDALEHAHGLLDTLAAGSQVAIVDSADGHSDQPLQWLSLLEAQQQLGKLKIRYANVPVSQALLQTLTQLDQAEPAQAGRPGRTRFVAVFSDRTRGSWDGGQLPALVDKLDRLAPAYEGLIEARGQIGALADMVRELPMQLPPPAAKDYNEQALLEALTALQNDLTALLPDTERWPPSLSGSVRTARRLCRDLLAQLPPAEPSPGEPALEFRGKLRAALTGLLRRPAAPTHVRRCGHGVAGGPCPRRRRVAAHHPGDRAAAFRRR